MKTEKTKMLAGEIYNSNYDAELIAERLACKEICYDYNQLRPTMEVERKKIIQQLFFKTG